MDDDRVQEFDGQSLAEFKGEKGKSVYIAYQGRVIDVSKSKYWRTGLHMKRHEAGRDLTADMEAAPHGTEVLDRYPQVGILKEKEEGGRPMPNLLTRLLDRFPVLRRHPHPMLVHFPIVFLFSPTLFNLLYIVTGVQSFEATAFHCLGAGIFFTPLAILTGYFTWWLNYAAKPMRPVTIKIRFSLLLLTISVLAFIWRFLSPGVFISFTGGSILYFFLILSLIPIVTVIGWFGATLTFPLEKK
jgi:predicted heme/steroid binding protein/uncharacterized membrane protein